MPSWIEQAMRRGILTTHYPEVEATEAEVPSSARIPLPAPGARNPSSAVDSCPVGALTASTDDAGRCIRCARCLPFGLLFSGPVESSAPTRISLVVPHRSTPKGTRLPAPLAALGRSRHGFMVDVGICNACNLEVLALANPFYDSNRLGIFFTNSPRHADVLLVVGVPTKEMEEPLRRAYDALPAPKAVVAVGTCPISGGVFAGAPGLAGPLEGLLPVDVFVPGCPPTPIGILDGLLTLAGRDRRSREV